MSFVDIVVGIIFLILTAVIFIAILSSTRTVSFNGPAGFLQSWMSSLIFSGIIAGGIIFVGYEFLSWAVSFVIDYWWQILLAIVVICYLFSSDDEKKGSTQTQETGQSEATKENPEEQKYKWKW